MRDVVVMTLAFLLVAGSPALAEDTGGGDEESTTRARIPLVFKYEREAEDKKVEILDLPFFEVGIYEKEGDSTKVDVLDAPLASLLKVRKEGDDESHVKFLNGPGTSLVKSSKTKDSKSFELLDVPMASLLRMEKHDNGDYDRRFLKLPIIGSLFRQTKHDGKKTTRFLFVFKHTKKIKMKHKDVWEEPWIDEQEETVSL